MLNPRIFFGDCIRSGKMKFWATGMPWNVIESAIDNVTFEYFPSARANEHFNKLTGCQWNSLDEASEIKLSCPKCRRGITAPLTTCDNTMAWALRTEEEQRSGHTDAGETGSGYADRDFIVICSNCALSLNHDILRTQKFRGDMENLLLHDCPMPGTILTINGTNSVPVAESYLLTNESIGLPRNPTSSLGAYHTGFPNRLMGTSLRSRLLEVTDMKQHTSAHMNDVRTVIENGLEDTQAIKAAQISTNSGRLDIEAAVAIRRMMSTYWANSTGFGLDLVGAVIRQSSFVEKMHSIDWVHSPAVKSTMSHLITKYERFVKILELNPHQVAVPTLDVDLAWRKWIPNS